MNKNRKLVKNNQQQQFQNNPFQGFNPAVILNQIRTNPNLLSNLNNKQREMAQNCLNMLENNDTDGLTNMATNMFKANGQDFGEYVSGLRQQLGLK